MMIGSSAPGVLIGREDGLAQTIWKYPLDASGRTEVEMPGGAKVVEVAMQHGRFTLWAVVAPAVAMHKRVFYIAGTGHPIPEQAHTHLGTVHVDGFVFHVFEGFQ